MGREGAWSRKTIDAPPGHRTPAGRMWVKLTTPWEGAGSDVQVLASYPFESAEMRCCRPQGVRVIPAECSASATIIATVIDMVTVTVTILFTVTVTGTVRYSHRYSYLQSQARFVTIMAAARDSHSHSHSHSSLQSLLHLLTVTIIVITFHGTGVPGGTAGCR